MGCAEKVSFVVDTHALYLVDRGTRASVGAGGKNADRRRTWSCAGGGVCGIVLGTRIEKAAWIIRNAASPSTNG